MKKKCINIPDVQIDSKFINILISPIILKLPQPELKSGGKTIESNNLNTIGVTLIIEDQTKQHDQERSKKTSF